MRHHLIDGRERFVTQRVDPAIAEERWGTAVRANPAAVHVWAEGQVWRRHFEEAAPALLAIATEAPVDPPGAMAKSMASSMVALISAPVMSR